MRDDPGIALSLFAISHRRIGGTESAIYNLANGLASVLPGLDLLVSNPNRLSPGFVTRLPKSARLVTYLSNQFAKPGVRFIEEALFSTFQSKYGCVIFPNYFGPIFRRRSVKQVVIVHDIQYVDLPQYHSWLRRTWLNIYLRHMIHTVDVVITISEEEKRKITQEFGCSPDLIHVIPNAIDFERLGVYIDTVSEVVGQDEADPAILSVYHSFPHKNIGTLIEAFNDVVESFPRARLWLVGVRSSRDVNDIRNLASDAAYRRIELKGFISDLELGVLYRQSSVYVSTSLYEGFGMPAVEAIGCGTYAIVSDLPAVRETTLGGAHYVDANSQALDWAREIKLALAEGRSGDLNLARSVRAHYDPVRIASLMLATIRGAGFTPQSADVPIA